MNISDLDDQFNPTSRIISCISEVEDRDKLELILLKIQESISKLKDISSQYDERITQDDQVFQKHN